MYFVFIQEFGIVTAPSTIASSPQVHVKWSPLTGLFCCLELPRDCFLRQKQRRQRKLLNPDG
jgi:hypothetical protein